MKKRFLSLFLALALCVGLCAVPGFAADSDFVIDKEGWLVKYTGPGGDVVIPDGVTVIGCCVFKDRKDLTGVTIPEGVDGIAPEAFMGCTGLTSVTIPEGVTALSTSAFRYCTSLTSVTIPKSVDFIDGDTFIGTPWLKQQGDFAVVNGILIKYQGTSANVVIPGNVTTIASTAFSFNSRADLTSVIIPDGVTTIKNQAFFDCERLSSAAIPSSVTSIGACAFDSCDSLTDIYFGGSKAQWEAIQDNSMFSTNNPADVVIHYNSPASDPAPSFTDVPDWCSSAVSWAVGRKITEGVGNDRFAPGNQCANAMILTFLWRAAGEPDSTAALPVDITGKNLDYAETALRWAAEKGMVDQTLNPTANCTRASAVSYIWQALGKESAPASGFNDVPAGADYAAAVDWASANGIVEGYPDGSFHPDTVCSRGVIATMLHRAYVPSVRL